ncbi:lipocalin family protein [Aliiglaciecola sp. LCG003]|uniref:lipocalin family protein n=1 Tax=Aliiglaciecola sp. LCG003 TaxID=3053655 RepID=UPI00257392D5|nr:lipocalin family protein [Aliiglaciecola sp. LCG003]WJG09829.1 lipocalin family protein [Aliiglaciecola sp. LCG003]
MRKLAFLLVVLILPSCTSLPEGIKPIDNFNMSKYLGTWYELARLDHSFERGLEQVTAEYVLREDGGIDVINRGFDPESGKWDEANGKAYFVGEPSIGHLKVSFFGPFYASYVIFEMDQQDYQYALVTGPDRDYFWLLSRQKSLPDPIMQQLIKTAKDSGFPTEQLIYLQHPH